MPNNYKLSIGQPLTLSIFTPQSLTDGVLLYSSRIISKSAHTLSISIPYDRGKIILWPSGTKLQVTVSLANESYTFVTEIIGRDLDANKCYTIMSPTAISQAGRRSSTAGLSRVIAITSGKGGVGKTTFTINLAIALAAQGQKVFIIDADLGTANVDVLLHLRAEYNISHVIAGKKNLIEIAIQAPGNIAVIPGGSGLQELTQLNQLQFSHIINGFNQLDGFADIILLDTGAGISRDVSNFLLAADEVILVTTPEPHAITDAYAITKVMQKLDSQAKQMLVINRAENEAEAILVSGKLKSVSQHYLNLKMDYIGYIVDDRLISRSLKAQYPFMLSDPDAEPSRNIKAIANKLLHIETKPAGISGFINKFISLFKAPAIPRGPLPHKYY